jgi:hypothetical protein
LAVFILDLRHRKMGWFSNYFFEGFCGFSFRVKEIKFWGWSWSESKRSHDAFIE